MRLFTLETGPRRSLGPTARQSSLIPPQSGHSVTITRQQIVNPSSLARSLLRWKIPDILTSLNRAGTPKVKGPLRTTGARYQLELAGKYSRKVIPAKAETQRWACFLDSRLRVNDEEAQKNVFLDELPILILGLQTQ